MSDLKRCYCRECDFKSDDLVDHIEEKHGKLAAYIKKHKLKESDVIFQTLVEEKEEELGKALSHSVQSMKSANPEVSENTITIVDRALNKGEGSHNGAEVPEVDEHYFFGRIESNHKGTNVYDRKLGKKVQSIIQDLQENKRIMTVGHTGTGKSSLYEQLAARANQTCVRISCNGQITVGDMIGLYTIIGGDTVWIDGILTNAVRHGHWVILDEIDFAKEEILANLNALLEPKGKLVLKEKGFEVINPHPNFRMLATANTIGQMKKFRHLYQGTNEMNEAFLDRWRIYVIDYLEAQEEVNLILKRFPRFTKELATKTVEIGGSIRQSFLKEDFSTSFSTRKLLDWVDLMIRTKDPEFAAEIAIYSKIEDEAEVEAIKGIISRIIKRA